ncbi:uncharacterized protein PRCAT00005927001 [Priceomyces carsonii]|uniref:uncharacterized protein n=1 Tax=Priceomyces carsonii TaxID=28549 RepID=UPI002ED8B693|nr:unnamed protein product [Priceomyces carsonii]
MSNIPDITSLSDLLGTSPREPSRDIQNSLQLDVAEIVPYHQDQEQEQEEEQEQEPNDESDYSDHNRIENFEELLSRQNMKLSLVNERDSLLRERTHLKTKIDELVVKVQYMKDMRSKEFEKSKLKDLLEESDLKSATNEDLRGPSDEQDVIIENLHVLPSNNWLERIRMVKLFQKHIEIDKIKTTNYYDSNSKLRRAIEFLVISPLLFKLSIKVAVDTKDESLTEIIINQRMFNSIGILSSSFATVLYKDYVPKLKLNLIMFGLNSLSQLLHVRANCMLTIIKTFSHLIEGERFSEIILFENMNNKLKVMARLKSLDQIVFTFSKSLKTYRITLFWDIVLTEVKIAECGSKITLTITDGTKFLPEAGSLFSNLLEQHSVMDSLCMVLGNIFQKEH